MPEYADNQVDPLDGIIRGIGRIRNNPVEAPSTLKRGAFSAWREITARLPKGSSASDDLMGQRETSATDVPEQDHNPATPASKAPHEEVDD